MRSCSRQRAAAIQAHLLYIFPRFPRLNVQQLGLKRLDFSKLTTASFGQVDGVWASFSPAYVSNLIAIVAQWSDCVVEGGWVTLVEMDDLLGHQRVSPSSKKPFSIHWHRRIIGRRPASSSSLLAVREAARMRAVATSSTSRFACRRTVGTCTGSRSTRAPRDARCSHT